MSRFSKIARPYAEAAFEFAKQQDAIPHWSDMLAILALVVKQPQVKQVLDNPKITSEARVDIVVALAKKLDTHATNFVKQLAVHHRLLALSTIKTIYDELCAAMYQTMDVNITSAVPLTDAYKKSLAESLNKRFDRKVELHCEVDKDLLGGMKIRAGDMVVENSIMAQLDRLRTDLVEA